MRKDPTEFRERFKKWQSGEKVYEAGLPRFKGGKEGDNPPISPFEPMSMADIGDFEVKGNDASVGEALKAKEPIAAPGMALSPDAQKRQNVEQAIAKRFAFTKGQKNNISTEQYWQAYKNSAGFRTRWSRGMGQNNDDLFYKLGYNNQGVVNIRKNTEEGGSFYSPATRTVYFNPTSEGIMMLGGENEIRQHELNHQMYNSKLVEESKKYTPQTAPINKYNNPQAPVKQRSDWRRAVESKTGNVIDWSHDGNISEGGADAGALGMSLYQDGVFNRMDPNARITKDELNKWHEGFKKKNGGIGHRFIETYGTDRAVDLLNNTASLNTQKYDPNRLAQAKYGLEKFNLPKFEEGTAVRIPSLYYTIEQNTFVPRKKHRQ